MRDRDAFTLFQAYQGASTPVLQIELGARAGVYRLEVLALAWTATCGLGIIHGTKSTTHRILSRLVGVPPEMAKCMTANSLCGLMGWSVK